MARIWCWMLGHDWVYQYSYTARLLDPEYPFGGFRAKCCKCGKNLNVRYTKHLEMREVD